MLLSVNLENRPQMFGDYNADFLVDNGERFRCILIECPNKFTDINLVSQAIRMFLDR